MADYAQYVDYIRSIQASHLRLQKFYVGGIERILGANRGEIEYPCLWLELPKPILRWQS